MRCLLLLLLALAPTASRAQESVTVFAAASLTDGLRELGEQWTRRETRRRA